jgi:hypothetical protein
MTDSQRNNLILLIKNSTILSFQEKEEWHMLLDLMNDKQVGELERILKPAPRVVASPPANLPLSHIVNLPKPVSVNPAPQKPGIQPQVKVPSRFAEQLNKILGEKELPAEKAELDLPPAPSIPTPPVKNVILPKPVLPSIVVPKSVTAAPKPYIEIKEKPLPVSPPPKTLEQALSGANTIPPVKYDSDNLSDVDLRDISEKIQSQPKSQPSVRAGLQNQDMLFQAAVLRPQRPATTTAAPAKPGPKVELSPSVQLSEVVDAAGLSLDLWKKENHTALTERLKKIISRRGYHEVIFNLQKSPLYSSYIDAGLKSLESGKSFEGLGEGYMSKKEFEDFTDMLRELQI